MESDDDFLPPTQLRIHGGSNRQAVTSTSRQAWDRPGPSRPSQPSQSYGQSSQSQGRPSQSQSHARLSQEEEVSQIQDGIKFLIDRVHQLTGDSRGTKRPAESKPFDKRPDIKEQCELCKKYYANKTTLFRHYRAMHGEMNPEKYHGCSVNSTVVSLDSSFRENNCNICGYAAASQNALDTHNREVHPNVINSNNASSDVHANVTSNVVNNNLGNASNKENVSNNAVMNKMHKCEECACYFEERNKFDEHMKVQHGYEFACHICNKNLLFKDVDGHVKEVHPDVYKKNKEKNEKVIIEKMMRNTKGNRVLVFVCTKCDLKMVDKIEADKHARGHKKGLKIKAAPRVKVSKAEDNFTDVTSNDHVILTCVACDISTGFYDAAVEHAQNHITNNLNDVITQQCLICELKFEPLCYKDHVDLHYKNKEIHKESFRYFKYRHRELLYGNGFSKEPELKKMIDESIYRHTRSVRMRATQGGKYNLYKCCQCDSFVDPAAVQNHTNNFDTCVKVKCIYKCKICQRKLNNQLARNNHTTNHKREEEYKTVLFNHESDKEFNRKLINLIEDAGAPKILYKCLCGLSFVRKENADAHLKICPGKDPRTLCPKCDNVFNPDEFLVHCQDQHLDQTPFSIENFSPDVIVINDDEEADTTNVIIEIDSSEDDNDEAESERFNNIKIEVASEAIEKLENDIDKNEERTDKITEDDSQDTTTYANTASASDVVNPVMINQNTVKCVPTNLLLNPFHFKNQVGGLNAEITSSIKAIRQQLETTNALGNELFDATIKTEESWFDPTNFSNIRSRPSLRPAPDNFSQDIVDLLLTDDEETDMNHDEAEIYDIIRSDENNDMRGDVTDTLSNTPITEQRQKECSSNNEDITAILQNEDNIIEESAENNAEAQPETTNINGEGVINDTSHSSHDAVNNDENYSDDEDDLFLPSGIVTREKPRNDEREMSNEQQLVTRVESHNNRTQSDNNIEQSGSGIENREKLQNTDPNNDERMSNEQQLVTQLDAGISESQIKNNDEQSEATRVENPQDDTENDIRSDEANDILNTKPNGKEICKETYLSREHVQNNHDEDTLEYVEFSQNETSTYNVINDIAEHTREDTSEKQTVNNEVRAEISEKETVNNEARAEISVKQTVNNEVRAETSKGQRVNIKKEFGYMDINIKRERIEENIQESEKSDVNGCEVRIKTEPIDNENDSFIINKENINYNHCSIC